MVNILNNWSIWKVKYVYFENRSSNIYIDEDESKY